MESAFTTNRATAYARSIRQKYNNDRSREIAEDIAYDSYKAGAIEVLQTVAPALATARDVVEALIRTVPAVGSDPRIKKMLSIIQEIDLP